MAPGADQIGAKIEWTTFLACQFFFNRLGPRHRPDMGGVKIESTTFFCLSIIDLAPGATAETVTEMLTKVSLQESSEDRHNRKALRHD